MAMSSTSTHKAAPVPSIAAATPATVIRRLILASFAPKRTRELQRAHPVPAYPLLAKKDTLSPRLRQLRVARPTDRDRMARCVDV